MRIQILSDKRALSAAAASDAAMRLRSILGVRQQARVIAATGASQIEFLSLLTAEPGIDWKRIELFHLDEYVGIPVTHPASFRRYLLDRLIEPKGIENTHLLDGQQPDLAAHIAEVGRELQREPIDLAFVGIGENGHLAFNDPPADFHAEAPFLILDLDEACRRQQVGEGWFASVDDVPRQAISMSIRQILLAREILCIVPDARKAQAVQACLEGEVRTEAPASILRTHPNVTVYLDRESGALLSDAA